MTGGGRKVSARSVGFTLIEVLIAITVLSVGLLGLAALQVAALQNGKQSFQRTQASALAYDIADRMRANRVTAITGNAYPTGYTVTTSTLPSAASSTVCNATSTTAAPCTGAQLAAWDVSNWAVSLRAQLTGGTATISCATTPCTASALQTVTVMWDEFRTGATGTTCPGPTTFNKNADLTCFSISFTP